MTQDQTINNTLIDSAESWIHPITKEVFKALNVGLHHKTIVKTIDIAEQHDAYPYNYISLNHDDGSEPTIAYFHESMVFPNKPDLTVSDIIVCENISDLMDILQEN